MWQAFHFYEGLFYSNNLTFETNLKSIYAFI